MGHRRFLGPDHSFRSDAASFDGTIELREPPVQPSSLQISEMTKGMMTVYGKLKKPNNKGKRKRPMVEEGDDLTEQEDKHNVETTFKKRSVFFQLKYWDTLQVRHNLDPMHIQKNVFENIVNTILNVDKRTKDNLNPRRDIKRMKIRKDLHVDESQPKPELPKAQYHMSADAKKVFLQVIKYARFPDGSPNSFSLAAMGTVQNIGENALGSDGKPLFDYVEVLVNYVINETTKLPRANGRIKTLKGATAKCIPWPRININLTMEAELDHRKSFENIDKYFLPKSLRTPSGVEEWRRTGIQPDMTKKRKRSDNVTCMTDSAKANSQAVC